MMEGIDMSMVSAGQAKNRWRLWSCAFAMEESTDKGPPQACVPSSDLGTWFPQGFISHWCLIHCFVLLTHILNVKLREKSSADLFNEMQAQMVLQGNSLICEN